MEISEEVFNQIHAYLRGEGSPEERTAFEQQMNQYPEIAQEAASQKRIKAGLKANENKRKFKDIHAQLKAQGMLPEVEAEQMSVETQTTGTTIKSTETITSTMTKDEKIKELNSRSRPMWQSISVAAGVVLVAGIGWYIYSGGNDEVTKPEVAQQTDTNPKIVVPPVSEPTASAPQTEPEKLDEKKPKSSPLPSSPDHKALFAQNFKPNPTIGSPFSSQKLGVSPSMVARWQSDTATLHEGIRLLQSGLGRSALAQFEKIEKSPFEEIQQHSQWYIALSLLWQSQLAKTQERLELIAANDKHLYQARAKKLLEKLKPAA